MSLAQNMASYIFNASIIEVINCKYRSLLAEMTSVSIEGCPENSMVFTYLIHDEKMRARNGIALSRC